MERNRAKMLVALVRRTNPTRTKSGLSDCLGLRVRTFILGLYEIRFPVFSETPQLLSENSLRHEVAAPMMLPPSNDHLTSSK